MKGAKKKEKKLSEHFLIVNECLDGMAERLKQIEGCFTPQPQPYT